MGSNVRLSAADGHQFSAYVAEGGSSPRVALVLLQEIFGVNHHIRSIADDYSGQGFSVIAPSLFDRVEPGLKFDYDPSDVAEGMRVATLLDLDAALKDVEAAINYGRSLAGPRVAALGYCFGGTLAWFSATRLNLAAAVCYYGGRIVEHAAEVPRCAVMLHFGTRDPHIPSSKFETIQRFHPDLPLFLYNAGHGFDCDQRADFQPEAASLARQRTIEFLHTHLSAK
jgi:carboxymethylenebutenolidase